MVCSDCHHGELLAQVTAALNEAESAQHEIPYAFIQHLIQAPSALEALHQSLKIGSGMHCHILKVAISRQEDPSKDDFAPMLPNVVNFHSGQGLADDLQVPQMRQELLMLMASGQLQWVILRQHQQHQQLPVGLLTYSLAPLCSCCLCRAEGMLQPALSC